MPEALPTSAWQPPVAPAIIALLAVTIPNALAQKKKGYHLVSRQSSLFAMQTIHLGSFLKSLLLGWHRSTPWYALTSFVAIEFSIA